MARSLIRPVVLVLVGTTVAVAQSRLTTADYDRASRMLAPALNGLVVGGTANVTWLPDGRFSYQRTSLAGTDNVVVDPVKKTREVVATPSASGQTPPVEGAGRGGGRGAGRGGRGNMAITNKTCGPNVTGMPGNPAESMSPDGTRAIFICDWNLWVRDAPPDRTASSRPTGKRTSAMPRATRDGQRARPRRYRGHPTARRSPLNSRTQDFHRAMSEDNLDMSEYLWSPLFR